MTSNYDGGKCAVFALRFLPLYGAAHVGGNFIFSFIFIFLLFIMQTQIIGSYELELKCNGDRTFLNFWDSTLSNHVCVELKQGKLMQYIHSEDEIEHEEFDLDLESPMAQKEISLEELVGQIETSIKAAKNFHSH